MRPRAPVSALLAFLASLVSVACTTPPKDPPRDGADGSSAVDVTAAPRAGASSGPTTKSTTPSAKTPGKSSPCASDAECRTFSSYCAEAPCACRILAKTDGDPACVGGGQKVSCFVDPCLNKAARCQDGGCVLTAKGAAATSM